MLLNCGIGDDSWESLGLQGDPSSPFYSLKEISPEYSLEGLILKLKLNTLATWCELTHLNRPWCWERLKAGGEGDERGCDCWMASATQCSWVWVNSGNWWWTGRPGVLQYMGLQRVRQDWGTELISNNRKVSHHKCLKITRLVRRFLLRKRNISLRFLLNGEGTQLHPSTENWIKDLLSMSPPIRTRPSFPHS